MTAQVQVLVADAGYFSHTLPNHNLTLAAYLCSKKLLPYMDKGRIINNMHEKGGFN